MIFDQLFPVAPEDRPGQAYTKVVAIRYLREVMVKPAWLLLLCLAATASAGKIKHAVVLMQDNRGIACCKPWSCQ